MIKKVYLLQHLNTLDSGMEDIKTIGIYSSYEYALNTIKRMSKLPGFSDSPELIDPLSEENKDNVNGFYIDEYEVDKDFWIDGFITI